MLTLIAAAALSSTLMAAPRVAIVSSSAAADGQTTLQYAQRDANRMAEVLRELGGFQQVEILHQPTARALREALDRAEHIAAADPKTELLIFYSGHADKEGLLLGKERLPYLGLRERLDRSRAAVRVLMLDACQSGGAVNTKGGRPTGGFPVESNALAPVAGAAILTASTAGELAQESSEIEGSYFTHHMLSALRGAADRNGNHVVTLGEAYDYVASHTVATTLSSLWGPQHPVYEYRLSGTGDLVLTNLARGTSGLSFPSGRDDRYFVTTRRNEVIAELALHPTRRTRLALAAGRYRVVRRLERQASVADVVLTVGSDARIEDASFRETAPELALAKGRGSDLRNEVLLDLAVSGLGSGMLTSTGEVGLGWMYRGTRWQIGPHVSYGRTDGSFWGVDYEIARWTATVTALRRFHFPLVDVRIGAGAGLAAIRQTLAGRSYAGLAPVAMGSAALDVPVLDWLSVRTMWSGGVELLELTGKYHIEPEVRGSVGTLFLF